MPVIEMTLEQFQNDSDWAHVFGESGESDGCSTATDECPPGSSVDRTPPRRKDVAEVVALVNGENDCESWEGVFRLKDGRFLVASGWCDYTGWG